MTNTASSINSGRNTIALYASTDGTIDTFSIPIASVTKKLKIKPNKALKLAFSIKTLPIAAGNYTILAQITDGSGLITDAVLGTTLTVEAPFTDLAATVGAIKPVTVSAGKALAFTLILTNSGNVASTGKMSIAFGLSSDGVTLAIPIITESKSETIKPGGKAVPVRLSFRIPKGTAPGAYFPYLSLIQGTAELNVVGSVQFTVT